MSATNNLFYFFKQHPMKVLEKVFLKNTGGEIHLFVHIAAVHRKFATIKKVRLTNVPPVRNSIR